MILCGKSDANSKDHYIIGHENDNGIHLMIKYIYGRDRMENTEEDGAAKTNGQETKRLG